MEIKINNKVDAVIEFSKHENKEIEISGMIQNIRVLSWGAFLILRTPKYTIQTVINSNKINFSLEDLTIESAVKIKGIVKSSSIKDKAINPRDFEIQVTDINIISKPSVSPLPVDTSKKELNVNLSTKFDLRHFGARVRRECHRAWSPEAGPLLAILDSAIYWTNYQPGVLYDGYVPRLGRGD